MKCHGQCHSYLNCWSDNLKEILKKYRIGFFAFVKDWWGDSCVYVSPQSLLPVSGTLRNELIVPLIQSSLPSAEVKSCSRLRIIKIHPILSNIYRAKGYRIQTGITREMWNDSLTSICAEPYIFQPSPEIYTHICEIFWSLTIELSKMRG